MNFDQVLLHKLIRAPCSQEREQALLALPHASCEKWERSSAKAAPDKNCRFEVTVQFERHSERSEDIDKITVLSGGQHSGSLPNYIEHEIQHIPFNTGDAERPAKQRQASVAAADIDELTGSRIPRQVGRSEPHDVDAVRNFSAIDNGN
jgi:hypothetical protein